MGKYQAYLDYKDSGVEWLGDIPISWIALPIKMVSKIFNGATPKSGVAPFWDGDIPWVTPADLGKSVSPYISKGSRSITAAGYNSCGVSLVPKNSIILASRAPIGTLGIASNDLCTNQGCKSLVVKDRFVPEFLYYVLLSSTEQLNLLGRGSTFLELSADDLGSYKIPSPSECEQQKIASFLDHETAKIDTLIDKQQQLIQLLKEKRQAVISHAVTKGLNPNAPMRDSGVEWLGEVPEHWVVTRLKYQVKMLPGFAFKSSGFVDSPEEVNLLRGINIAPGRTRWDDVVYWPRHDHDDLSEYALQEKDLVLGMDRPWVGDGLRLAMISSEDLPAYVVQRVARIRGVDGISQEYLFNLLSSPSFSSYFDPITTGVSVPHISTDQIGEYCFALPSESEREDIVEFISSSISKYKKLIRGAESAIELMQERRTALISAAVTGKIDVRHHVSRPAGNDTIG